MEESKKIFVVGKKPTKLYILVFSMAPLFFSLILSAAVTNYFKLGIYGVVVIGVTFFVLLLLFVPTIVRARQYWCINGQYLEHYAVDEYFQQLKYVISILTEKNDMYAFKIKLSEIKSIRIYWTTMWIISSTPVYPIYFGITFKDGSIVTFKSLVTTNNKEYVEAVKYLKEKCNILIEDKYDLLGAMEDKNIRLAEYIYEIEREQVKWGMKND